MLNSLFSKIDYSHIREKGIDKWMIKCPVHDDKDFAMIVDRNHNGSVSAHCLACGANGLDLYRSVGADFDELFGKKLERDSNFVPKKIIDTLVHELIIIAICEESEYLKYSDKKRLRLAEARVKGIYLKYPNIK